MCVSECEQLPLNSTWRCSIKVVWLSLTSPHFRRFAPTSNSLCIQFVWPKIKPEHSLATPQYLHLLFAFVDAAAASYKLLQNCWATQACVVFNLCSSRGSRGSSSLFSFHAYSFIHSFIESVFNSRPVQNSFLGAFHAIFFLCSRYGNCFCCCKCLYCIIQFKLILLFFFLSCLGKVFTPLFYIRAHTISPLYVHAYVHTCMHIFMYLQTFSFVIDCFLWPFIHTHYSNRSCRTPPAALLQQLRTPYLLLNLIPIFSNLALVWVCYFVVAFFCLFADSFMLYMSIHTYLINSADRSIGLFAR